ncbi:protein YeeZ [Capsicum chacoense]
MEICRLPSKPAVIHIRPGRTAGIYSIKRPAFSPDIKCRVDDEPKTKNPNSKDRMFILGMGFVGKFLAADLKKDGWQVTGTCTSTSRKKKLEEIGFNAHIFDANEPLHEVFDIMKFHSHLLISVPPVLGVGDPVLQHKELLKEILTDGNLQWLGYLSSTSVYGNCGGAWVDEEYPPSPMTELAKARLAAEEEWLQLACDVRVTAQIFRLGGIYGPGRSAVDTILRQEPLSKGQKMRFSRHYTSRIHVADICQALKASIQRPSPGKIYNVVDDDPAPREQVFKFAKNLVEKKWPGHLNSNNSAEDADSLILQGISRGEKRVSNKRIKTELDVTLLYPTYESGLQSIIKCMQNPFYES